MIELKAQSETDRLNSEFWDELCGTKMARSIGVVDDSPESLSRFDRWYFNYYPYLFDYIPFIELEGKTVLEIGPGYGTVGKKLIENGAVYHALDIADGPVEVIKKRLAHVNVSGVVKKGSILSPPYSESMFDWVIAIGSLHHTGDLKLAIDRVHRLLKPQGHAIVMVYNALSYRHWVRKPVETLRRYRKSPESYCKDLSFAGSMGRYYDTNLKGEPSPQVEFVTKKELSYMCRGFQICNIYTENIGSEGPLKYLPRKIRCRFFGPSLGLDLYCHLRK